VDALKFDEGKYKSSEIYGTPKDPALKQEYEEYLKKRLENFERNTRRVSHDEPNSHSRPRGNVRRHGVGRGPTGRCFTERRVSNRRSGLRLGRDGTALRPARVHGARDATIGADEFAGPAVTVQLKKEEHKEGSAASQGMLDLIDSSPPGSVYVMVLEDGVDFAGIGGLMATAMKYRGFAGAVIDASVRDTPQIRKLQFPVFSRGVAPSTTINHYRVAGVNVPVTCAGVRVQPGDIIAADEDGVAVVPQAKAAEVLKKSQELDDIEHRMLPFIEKYRSIKEAVKQFGRI
jgi:regulator of RNase E activity RraA